MPGQFVQQPKLLASEDMTVVFKLADGTSATRVSGDPLPSGLPEGFLFYLLATQHLDDMADTEIFIGTHVEDWRFLMKSIRDMTPHKRMEFVYGAIQFMETVRPSIDEVHRKMERGGKKAAKTWDEYLKAAQVIMAYAIVERGATIKVLLELPEKGAHMEGVKQRLNVFTVGQDL